MDGVLVHVCIFFFQAEDGIRDDLVTGVQTCALPICAMTLGAVYLVFQYTQMLRQPLEQINRQIQDLQRAAASVARVRELLDTPLAVPDGPGAPLPPGPLGVELDGVSFAYGQGPAVLR